MKYRYPTFKKKITTKESNPSPKCELKRTERQMGLDDQVTCYSGTSARAVNHCDVSDRSMEPELGRLMQKEERLRKGYSPACLLGLTGLKAVLEFVLVKNLSVCSTQT